ncbi:MAG: flagellar hook-basal body complex protein FliE [Gammaproteobacteria bacterium]|nr:flagellar hook-basal body complex protein FliE [Gammaproteobacteria bacterium]
MTAVDPQAAATSLIAQLDSMRDNAAGLQADRKAGSGGDFSAVFRQYIDQVNSVQQQATALAADFESGARDVQLLDVMVSLQKSRIAFEALTQVRNRFLSAYQEIMNMQV